MDEEIEHKLSHRTEYGTYVCSCQRQFNDEKSLKAHIEERKLTLNMRAKEINNIFITPYGIIR